MNFKRAFFYVLSIACVIALFSLHLQPMAIVGLVMCGALTGFLAVASDDIIDDL